MKLRFFKCIGSCLLWALLLCFPAQAAQDFPFMLSAENGSQRLCYCGHSGGGINYAEGQAVTPDTVVTLMPKSMRNQPAGDASLVSMEIGLIYENADKTGTVREVLRRFERGSLQEGDRFPLLSDVVAANLRERHRLYSDSLHALEVRLSYGEKAPRSSRTYFYICSQEEYQDFIERGDLPDPEGLPELPGEQGAELIPAPEQGDGQPSAEQQMDGGTEVLLGASPDMPEDAGTPSDIPGAPPAGGGYRIIR